MYTSVKKGGILGFSGCKEHTSAISQLIREARKKVRRHDSCSGFGECQRFHTTYIHDENTESLSSHRIYSEITLLAPISDWRRDNIHHSSGGGSRELEVRVATARMHHFCHLIYHGHKSHHQSSKHRFKKHYYESDSRHTEDLWNSTP